MKGAGDGTVRVLIAAGGTGGHVYPALAVAAELRAAGVQVFWLGTRAGLEARAVPASGIPIEHVRVQGLRGKGALAWALAPLHLAVALGQCVRVVARLRPDVVLGMGGFVSGPGGLAAWLLRRPLVVHEQNAVPGLTNRLLGRLAQRVMEAFPGSFAPRYRATHTGNPVRADITALAPPEARLEGRDGRLRVLVLGGSQGAQALNEVLPLAVAGLARRQLVDVYHQAGGRHLEQTRAHYAEAGIEARLVAFIDDMAAAYGWADVVVCRAGAMTVFELAAAGVASILVPYPHAVDDHQTHNARYLSEHGAAVLMPQPQLNAGSLGRLLGELHGARARLLAMARAARARAVPDAAARVSVACTEVALA